MVFFLGGRVRAEERASGVRHLQACTNRDTKKEHERKKGRNDTKSGVMCVGRESACACQRRNKIAGRYEGGRALRAWA